MRRYIFTGTLNMRDLGGHPTKDKCYTRYKTFIRSDAPLNLSDQEIQTIITFGITTIIDLRNPKIVELSPNSFSQYHCFECFNYAIADGLPSPKTEAEFIDMYFQMTVNKHIMTSLFKTMADCDGGVLFHCQEGKDRTGVVSAILLSLANVFEDDICADYQVSGTYFKEYTRKALEAWNDMPVFFYETKADYMELFLQLFYEKYRSAAEYLHLIGLTDVEIEKLKTKLVSASCL